MDGLKQIPEGAIIYRDEKGEPQWFMVPEKDNTEYAFTGKVFLIYTWGDDGFLWEEVAIIYLKWDACCHVGVGDPEMGGTWAHICGREREEYDKLLKMLGWMWDEAKARIPKWNP